MKMVYIASPLRGDYNTNIKNAVEYCRLAGEQGVLPLAPHIIFSQWCNDTIPEQREQGLQLGLTNGKSSKPVSNSLRIRGFAGLIICVPNTLHFSSSRSHRVEPC